MADEPASELMLRDLRETGANLGHDPCAVHQRPQWTCAFCLYSVLESLSAALAQRTAERDQLQAACVEVDNGYRRCVLCRQSRHMQDWTNEDHDPTCPARRQ